MTLKGVIQNDGGSAFVPLEIELGDCLFQTLEQVGSEGDIPIFSVTIVPSTIHITTRYLNNTGTVESEEKFGWSYVTGGLYDPDSL